MQLKAFALRVETFGLGPGPLARIGAAAGRPPDVFETAVQGEPRGRARLPLFSAHNVRNALAAMAASNAAGLSVEDDSRTARVSRRQTASRTAGGARGVGVRRLRPSSAAIQETLRSVRAYLTGAYVSGRDPRPPRRVFQDDFARAFGASGADEIILAAVFRSSLPESERLSVDELVRDLRKNGQHARHIATVPEIVATIAAEARSGDLVVIMSNGGFDGIHDKLLQALAE